MNKLESPAQICETDEQDNPRTMRAEIMLADYGPDLGALQVTLTSYDLSGKHAEFAKLIGKRIRVIVEYE